MRWEGREESYNVEDRRGMPGPGMALGGGGMVVMLLLGMAFGVDPGTLIHMMGGARSVQQQSAPRRLDPAEEQQARFTKVVLRDTELVWGDLFQRAGKRYPPPVLVLFRGSVDSACGLGQSATGPFYCPGDRKVYIDLSFYRDMERKLNAPGEFARAYVIAHEVGHHVQKLLGFSRQGDMGLSRGPRTGANSASVRLELQADFLAGVWAHHAQRRFNFLEAGDVDSALRAAFEIGDDRLQSKSRGHVVPDSFTHGTSEQRMAAFKEGLRTGDVGAASQFFQ